MPVLQSWNLLILVADLTQKRLVENLTTTAIADQLSFTRGDVLKGTLYIMLETGVPSPLFYQVLASVDHIALTNGSNTVYAEASGFQALGGTTSPHIAFNLDVTSTALDAALAAVSGNSLPAVLEIHMTGLPALEGTAHTQSEYILREPCFIFKTALNPLP